MSTNPVSERTAQEIYDLITKYLKALMMVYGLV